MNTSYAASYDPSYDETNLPPEEAELRRWITVWYQTAVRVGYIEPEYELDQATAERLEDYLRYGLTPAEGADVMFGLLH